MPTRPPLQNTGAAARTLAFTAVWSDFERSCGVVMDGCDNTRDELENFCGHDHNDFLHWVGAPDGPGTWKFDGLVSVFKTFEGDYDADAVGTWTRVAP